MESVTLKREALDAISKLPETADVDDIMYRLYVIDKVRKARESFDKDNEVSVTELEREIESW